MKRICIVPKDVERITGKSDRHCRRIIQTIKKQNNKLKHQSVTIHEFCAYMGLKIEDVEKFIY